MIMTHRNYHLPDKKTGRKIGQTIYAIWKNEEYVGEGTIKEMTELTGLRRPYIQQLASPSHRKTNKKWLVEILVRDEASFAPYERVNYSKLRKEMKRIGYKPKDMEEILELNHHTIAHKIAKRIRFRYTELEELEDLFFLEEGGLLK